MKFEIFRPLKKKMLRKTKATKIHTDEEMLDLVQKAFERVGAHMYFQAKTIVYTCKVICNTRNPRYHILQPKIKIDTTSPAWNNAYMLVLAYLKKLKMKQTLKAIKIENTIQFTEQAQPKNIFEADNVESFYTELLNLNSDNVLPEFDTRVDEFINDFKYEDVMQDSPVRVKKVYKWKALEGTLPLNEPVVSPKRVSQ